MRIFLTLFLGALPAMAPAGDFAAAAQGLPNAHLLSDTLVSSGQPAQEQLNRLAGEGLAAVINLRTTGEDPGFDEAAVLRAADVAYYQVPVAGSGGLTHENATRLDRLLQRHAGQPVLVHCASGNRVGALFAVRAHWLQGSEADAAIDLGRKAGMTRLEAAVGSLLTDE